MTATNEENTKLKKFYAHLVSESCDHYDIEWRSDRLPQNREEWLKVLNVYFEGWEEVEYMYPETYGETPDSELDIILMGDE